jgi:hypothetical protein
VESAFARKLPESVFPLRQQTAKRRQVEAMLGGFHGLKSPINIYTGLRKK